MTAQTEVIVDFNAPRITWGVADDTHAPVEFTLTIRELAIDVIIQGPAVLRRSEIRAHLQRGLKYFIRDQQLHDEVQYKKTVLYRMANYTDVDVNQWADRVAREFDTNSTYNIWANIACPHEMLVMDAHHQTSIITNQNSLDIGCPVALEFVKSEGGIVFNHHRLGLGARTHQAEAGLKIRRDMARRTRGGGQFSTFGILELREVNGLVELHVGEDHLWSIDPAGEEPVIIPNKEHFSDWGVMFAISDPSANRYMALYTLKQLKLIA